MTTYTQAELIEKALQKLKVVGSGQTASAEDSATVLAALPSIFDDLSVREIYYVGDVEAIEAAPFLYLADVVAFRCSSEFAVSSKELQELDALNTRAEDRLETIARRPNARGYLKIDSALTGGARRGSYRF